MRGLWLIVAVLVALLWWFRPAPAHDAPSGWSYPFECCSGYDCREVDGPDASTRQHDVQVIFIDGDYVISTTGERIPEFDAKVKESPDGAYHWCSQGGKDDTGTICLFVPAKLF